MGRFGQTKLPGNRERVISSQKLQFVDRSLVNARFNLDRDKGIQLYHSSGTSFVFKQAIALSMGEGRNVIIDNPYNGHQITARVEFLPMGEFTGGGDYFGSDLRREKSPKLSVGISGDVNKKAARTRGNLGNFLSDEITGEYLSNDLKTFMADLMFKYNGFSFASEYAKRTTDNTNNGFGTGDGIVFQGGYLLPSNWEFAGRYTIIDGNNSSPIADVKETTFGISKYVRDHNLKIQTDISRQDFANRDDQLIFRFQTELAF
jgi:phosphate-selective porin OprO/OprP